MNANPYFIDGPAVISFSGGRSSGYMLKHILDAHDGNLPDDVQVVFCNTGKEMPQTLDFVQECSERWNVKINWLEYRWQPGRNFFEVVSHNSASRNGEPFDMLIEQKSKLPNAVTRFCSKELKIQTPSRWVRAQLDWHHWTNVLGLRADEPHRVARAKARNESGDDIFDNAMPMASAGVVRTDVHAFWNVQPFNLRLLDVGGRTPDGNCDNCFMKSLATLAGRARRDPDSFAWWIAAEQDHAGQSAMKKFCANRPDYAAILKGANDQGDMFGDDDGIDCACTD